MDCFSGNVLKEWEPLYTILQSIITTTQFDCKMKTYESYIIFKECYKKERFRDILALLAFSTPLHEQRDLRRHQQSEITTRRIRYTIKTDIY